MRKFNVTFLREFTVEVEAEDPRQAGQHILRQFPRNATKILSVIPEGYVEPTEPEKPRPPGNKPLGGGSPGTPTVKVPEIVDQVAKAA